MDSNVLLLALAAALSILVIVPLLLFIDAHRAAAYEKMATSLASDIKAIPQFQDPYLARYPETYFPRLMTEVKTPSVLPPPPPRPLTNAEKRMIIKLPAATPEQQRQAVMSMAKLIMMRHESRRSNRPRALQSP